MPSLAKSNSRLTIVSTDCGWCYDTGIETSTGLLVDVLGQEVYLDFQQRKVCCHCKEGLATLLRWQQEQDCYCEYGRRQSTHGGVEFCPTCSDGQTLSAQLSALIAARRQLKLEELVKGAGLTDELKTKTFHTFLTVGEYSAELSKALASVRAACAENKSLLLLGNTGTGKTHLAAAYLNQAIAEGRAGIFVSLVDLMRTLRRTIRAEDGSDWDATLEKYIDADLLVLDDLGQEKATEKVAEVVFHLLNSRINDRKPTVVTSNYSIKKLGDIGYSPAIRSRLASFEQVIWQSYDYRTNGKLKIVDPWDRPD